MAWRFCQALWIWLRMMVKEFVPVPFRVTTVEQLTELPEHVLFSLHGIRDDGSWAADPILIGRFFNLKLRVVQVRYRRISTWMLVLGLFAEEVRQSVVGDIRKLLADFPDAHCSIICHSNGTKVFSDIANEFSGVFKYFFYVGSICHHDDARRLHDVPKRRVLNDCGCKDYWPFLAAVVRPDTFGVTGVCGFNWGHKILDRYFPFGHGGGVTYEHIDRQILPVVRHGRPPLSTHRCNGLCKHAPIYLRYTLVALGLVLFLTILSAV